MPALAPLDRPEEAAAVPELDAAELPELVVEDFNRVLD